MNKQKDEATYLLQFPSYFYINLHSCHQHIVVMQTLGANCTAKHDTVGVQWEHLGFQFGSEICQNIQSILN